MESNKSLTSKCTECDSIVMNHFAVCPHCGKCQTKKCKNADKMLRESLTNNQVNATIEKHEKSHTSSSVNRKLG